MSLELVANRRWRRKRNDLPKPKYPSDDERRKLAELAKVGADNLAVFGQHICSLILVAHLSDSSLRGLSKPKTKAFLATVADQAEELSNNLRTIDVGSGGSAEHAGLLLEIELGKTQSILLPEYVALLGSLSDAAKRGGSAIKSRRGQRNLAFNEFIEGLSMAARQYQGQWTNYRAANQEWKGTMLDALEILKRYLPREFFPDGELGRSAEYAVLKLKQHITKNKGTRR